ncbi:MAG TPA: L-threonylcarbamoyladenylate synthase [Stellaceae bacterium]|nr:L-threonylcarbamoyladenylate synthase [Stellaceae bacterium]
MTELLQADDIPRAVELLRAGELVAFPTETVYGLGGDATNDRAVAAIFAAKDRPNFNPLIVHLPDTSAARRIVSFDARAEQLAATFWPGPLTLVLPRRADCGVSLLAGAGLDSLAVRVPAHPAARDLLRAVDRPIVAPSANRSGRLSPTTAAHVMSELDGRIAAVLDAGPCAVGLESTVLDLTGAAALLRPGAITAEQIAEVVGPLVAPGGSIRSPGMLAQHYAPALPLRLNATGARPGEALLGFGPANDATLNLSPGGDLVEAASHLFAYLRALDLPQYSGIAVMPIPDTGIGAAINDRLRRGAAKRET